MNDGNPVLHSSLLVRSRTLCLLASQLHHQKDEGIRRNTEQSRDSSLPISQSYSSLLKSKPTYVSPAVVLLTKVESLCILRTRGISAVVTAPSGVGASHIPSIGAQKVCHVFTTRLTIWHVEAGKLFRATLDLDVPDDGTHETAKEVVEGVEVVEPVLPERLHGVVGDYHTAEGYHSCTDEDGVHDCGEVLVWCVCCDGLADGGVQEFVD